jgi:hypothetical protein
LHLRRPGFNLAIRIELRWPLPEGAFDLPSKKVTSHGCSPSRTGPVKTRSTQRQWHRQGNGTGYNYFSPIGPNRHFDSLAGRSERRGRHLISVGACGMSAQPIPQVSSVARGSFALLRRCLAGPARRNPRASPRGWVSSRFATALVDAVASNQFVFASTVLSGCTEMMTP